MISLAVQTNALPIELRIIAIILAISFGAVVIELVRRRLLLEKYAFVWLIISAGMVVLVLFPDILLTKTASLIGISVPANMLFFLSLVLIGGFLLRLTVHVSQLNQKNTRLNQEFALLNEKVNSYMNQEEN